MSFIIFSTYNDSQLCQSFLLPLRLPSADCRKNNLSNQTFIICTDSEQGACPASTRAREQHREGNSGMYSSKAIWCNARGDSALAKRLSGFTLTWLPLCGLQIGPWEHVLSSSSQLRLKHHRPEDQSDQRLDQRAATRLPVPWMYLRCGKTLSSSRNTPTTSTRYLQKHFMLHQKHQSISVCVRPS